VDAADRNRALKLRRRELLRGLLAVPVVATGCGLLTPTREVPASSSATVAYSQPIHIPFQGAPPDIEGSIDGLPPAYVAFPVDRRRSVAQAPGRGGDVHILVPHDGAPPVQMEQNAAWQAINKDLGANLRVERVPSKTYLAEVDARAQRNDLPDLFYVALDGTELHDLADLVSAQCADLTPFLGGESIREFPNLGAFGPFRWPYGVFGSRLYAVPAASVADRALFAQGRVLDDLGVTAFNTSDDFLAAAHQLTQPGTRYAVAGNPLAWFLGVFRAPNDWREERGKLTKDVETDEFRVALEFVRGLWDDGLVHPRSPDMSPDQTLESWYAGQSVMVEDTYSRFQTNWDRARSADPNALPRIVAPFAFDGGAITSLLASAPDSLTVVRKASNDRVRELLGVVNYLVAPFVSYEYMLLNYGLQNRDYAVDSGGTPRLTQTGLSEVTQAPIWNVSAPTPTLFDADDPTFVWVALAAMAGVISTGVPSPVVGLHSRTAANTPVLLDQLRAGLRDIVFGRESLASLGALVAQWRTSGGDAIRSELEQGLQTRG
jgi:ABC-type glycerol-3-phosphate transport system substrate-binding protein